MRGASLFLYAVFYKVRQTDALSEKTRSPGGTIMGLDVLNTLAITVIAALALFLFSRLGKGG